jgi:hypothetical protein
MKGKDGDSEKEVGTSILRKMNSGRGDEPKQPNNKNLLTRKWGWVK